MSDFAPLPHIYRVNVNQITNFTVLCWLVSSLVAFVLLFLSPFAPWSMLPPSKDQTQCLNVLLRLSVSPSLLRLSFLLSRFRIRPDGYGWGENRRCDDPTSSTSSLSSPTKETCPTTSFRKGKGTTAVRVSHCAVS
jgi:hypothetical protein